MTTQLTIDKKLCLRLQDETDPLLRECAEREGGVRIMKTTPYTTTDLLFWWSEEHRPPSLDVVREENVRGEDYILRIRLGHAAARIWAERPADALALAGELERCARELRSHVARDTSVPEASAEQGDDQAQSACDPRNDPSAEVQP